MKFIGLNIKDIIYSKLFVAVEHANVQDNSQLNFFIVKKQKGEFDIVDSGVCMDIEEVSKKFKREKPLILVINNEQVITRKIQSVPEPRKAVGVAFPNLNIDAFYYETYQNKSDTFVSICRKEYVDNIIQEYEKARLSIIGFSLGNLITSQLLPYFDQPELQTSNALLSIQDQKISDIKKFEYKQERTYEINGLEINSSSVLGLAGILRYYTNQSFTHTNFTEKIDLLQNNFKQKRVFDQGLKVGLGFTFILLLVNFLIFSNYRDKINTLTNDIAVNESSKENFLILKEKVDKKKKIVDEISNSSNSKVSSYLDKIGVSVPNSILLTQINYQPLLRNIKKEKEIKYNYDEILIQGIATKGDEFSKWIASLEKETWIENVTVLNYGTGKKSKTEFSLKITLRE